MWTFFSSGCLISQGFEQEQSQGTGFTVNSSRQETGGDTTAKATLRAVTLLPCRARKPQQVYPGEPLQHRGLALQRFGRSWRPHMGFVNAGIDGTAFPSPPWPLRSGKVKLWVSGEPKLWGHGEEEEEEDEGSQMWK